MKAVVLRGGPCRDGLMRPADERDPSSTGRHGAIALSDLGEQWALVNVAPNVADQLAADPALVGHVGLRDGAVRSVVLTDAQVDHVSGLLSLRHGAPINLYATPAVFEVLSQNMPVLSVLQHYCGVHWHVIPVAGEATSAAFRVDGLPALEFTALATNGVAPPYVQEHAAHLGTGLSIAIAVRDLLTGQRLFCAPGPHALGTTGLDWMRSADCVMVDDLASWPQGEPAGTWRAQRKVVLGSRQPGQGGACPDGFETAYDGMVIDL